MDLEANYAKWLAESFHSELTQVIVFSDCGHPHAVVDELVAQPRRRRPLRAQDQLLASSRMRVQWPAASLVRA